MLLELGARIDYISAAWISFQTDPGLNLYAREALSQLWEATSQRRRWLKPTLLSTYGVLAAQSRPFEVAYRQSSKGERRAYPAGGKLLHAQAIVGRRSIESPVVNVMYRGLIEAEQRRRTLGLARTLHGQGHNVLAIYADSLFVEGTTVPLLPDGWRVDQALDDLQFGSATHFTSRTLSKLPGVPRDSDHRVRLMAEMRGHTPQSTWRPPFKGTPKVPDSWAVPLEPVGMFGNLVRQESN